MALPKKGVSLAVAKSGLLVQHPQPPEHLSDAATRLWISIVVNLPSSYFSPADLPLLEAYVIAHDRKRRLDAMIQAEGIVEKCCGHPAMAQSRAEAATMATLAGKLRLCQSARTRPDSAMLKHANAGNAMRDDDPFAEYASHPLIPRLPRG
ncbi:MAG: hypothetical protein V5B33_19940 [Candidatus Accumulibacter sp. UW20]|jgi:phage terminase small subunit